jgi:hypothetical protein
MTRLKVLELLTFAKKRGGGEKKSTTTYKILIRIRLHRYDKQRTVLGTKDFDGRKAIAQGSQYRGASMQAVKRRHRLCIWKQLSVYVKRLVNGRRKQNSFGNLYLVEQKIP